MPLRYTRVMPGLVPGIHAATLINASELAARVNMTPPRVDGPAMTD